MPVPGEETMGRQGLDQTGGPGDKTGSHGQGPRDPYGVRARARGNRGIAAQARRGDHGNRDPRPNQVPPGCAQQEAVWMRERAEFMNGRHGFR